MKFQILTGIHSEGGKTYEAGSVVDSKSDLSRFNAPGVERFHRLPDDPLPHSDPAACHAAAMEGCKELLTPQAVKDSFDGMTVAELRKFAEETEVDLGKAKNRDEILAALRAA